MHGRRASAGWWLSIAAVTSLIAVVLAMRFRFARRVMEAAEAA